VPETTAIYDTSLGVDCRPVTMPSYFRRTSLCRGGDRVRRCDYQPFDGCR